MPREWTVHSRHPLATIQETTLCMDITRWSIPKSNCLYTLQPKMEKLYTVRKNKTWSSNHELLIAKFRLKLKKVAEDGEALYSQQKQDCGSDHELLIAKFRLKLKKVGKTIRPFRYDLNKITCDYTVEVTNRFKGLDLIEGLKKYRRRFITLYRRW